MPLSDGRELTYRRPLRVRGSHQRPPGGPFLATHHEVGGCARVGMPEVDGVHAESLLQLVFVLDPVGFQTGISG